MFHRYGAKLGSRIFKAHSFSAYDMFMTLAPGTFLTLGTFILAFLGILVSVFHPEIRHDMLLVSLGTIGYSLLSTYVMMFTYGLITTITEWEKIHAPAGKKIKYLFTFPIYIFSYIPIGVTALFKKIQWVPIEHHVVKSADEIKSAS